MLKMKAPGTLQEHWVNEDRAWFNIWIDEEIFFFTFLNTDQFHLKCG